MSKSIKDQLLRYFYLKKRAPDETHNTNMKLMHGMNRISIFIFLIAIGIMVYRLLTR